MAKISQYFKDKAKTIKDYPKTLMKAVYGDDGKRLDNIISDITSDIDSTKAKIGATDISAIGDGTVTGGLNALNSNLTTKVEKNELNGILYLFKEWRGWSDGTHVLVEQPSQSYCIIHIQNDEASELLSFSRIGSPKLHHIAGDVIATNYITNGYTIQFDIPIYTQVMMYTIKTNL